MGLEAFFHKRCFDLQIIKISCTGDHDLLSVGFLISGQLHQTLDESLIRRVLFYCLLIEPTFHIIKQEASRYKIEQKMR